MQAMKFILPIKYSICLASLAEAQTSCFSPAAREPIEWHDLWIAHANEANVHPLL